MTGRFVEQKNGWNLTEQHLREGSDIAVCGKAGDVVVRPVVDVHVDDFG